MICALIQGLLRSFFSVSKHVSLCVKLALLLVSNDALGFLIPPLWLHIGVLFIILSCVLENFIYSLLDTKLSFNLAM